ncbi:MAG: hypothetical protein JNL60_00475 [Bacteroidia bacterium]|nr:hypothetical protein [Bacteroidia bacterium]
MKTSSKKLLAFALFIAGLTSLTFLKAEHKPEKKEMLEKSTKNKSVDPVLLEKVKAGYKFYSPCINYSGQLAKNEGC